MLGLGIAGMAVPSLVPAVPAPASPAAIIALGVGGFFYSLLILRALKTYFLTQRLADLAVVIGVAWLTAALPAALLLNYTDLGWWLGHGFELAGIVIVGTAVAIDLSRSVQSRPLVGDLQAAELVAEEEAFLGARVHALMQRLAEKDESTEEHTRRVALRAVQVGEELGLPPGRLRALAIGGLLHDIGKLSVPTRILQKPAALEEEEFAIIKRHPEWGIKLLRELGGFNSSRRNSSTATTSDSTARVIRAAWTQARSDSTHASSPSATSTTHWFRHASIAPPGTTKLRSPCSERKSAPRSTNVASSHSSAFSHASRCSRKPRRLRRGRGRLAAEGFQRIGQALPGREHAGIKVAVLADPLEHDRHGEGERVEILVHLRPAQARRDGAPGRGRTEYADAIVLPSPFWFASMSTPRRFAFVHSVVARPRCVRAIAPATISANWRVSAYV